MIFRSLRIGFALLALGLPFPVSAYLLPEDVLENNQYLIPPTHTEAPIRVRKQQKTSEERRNREQATYFVAQHPEPPQEEDFIGIGDSSETLLHDDEEVSDAEILRTARMLDRIEKKQLGIYSPRILRGRAPMVDTGPATLLMTIPFLAAAGWTWRKAGKKL
ncbi:hypothetical protein HY464_02255 [Candidatus Peregrinibacteria bacterium]|nr:hypothetical protein [Candidatus Peregrinibacteria bacterium]